VELAAAIYVKRGLDLRLAEEVAEQLMAQTSLESATLSPRVRFKRH